MEVITIDDKRDRTYDFHTKHNMSSLDWSLNKKLNKDNTPVTLITK